MGGGGAKVSRVRVESDVVFDVILLFSMLFTVSHYGTSGTLRKKS